MGDSAERGYCIHCSKEMGADMEACPRCGKAQGPGGPAARLLPPRRPTGVLVIAIVMLVSCALSVAMGAYLLKNMDVVVEKARPPFTFGQEVSERFAEGVPEHLRASVAIVVVVAVVIVVGLEVFLACFLLKMRNWARIVVIVLYCLGILWTPMNFLPGQIELESEVYGIGAGPMVAWYVIETAWAIFVVVYLLKVGAAFRPRPVGSVKG